MKTPLKTMFILTIILQTPAAFALGEFDGFGGGGDKSIYGDDNRIELFDASPETYRLADSVVSLWKAEDVQFDAASKRFSLKTEKYGDALGLCPDERFREQPIGAFCSGSLVGEDLIMTAGHCITDEARCQDTKIVFGFAIKGAGGKPPSKIAQKEVYSCKKIVTRFLKEQSGSINPLDVGLADPDAQEPGPDYALIQLDRKVAGHRPLRINRVQNLQNGDKIRIIGHPVGLPMKISGGTVRDVSGHGYFVTDLDTFGGNSGSPVFNSSTRLIEGILVRGAPDFLDTPAGCSTMAVYPQNGGRGEDVTKVSVLQAFIPRLDAKDNTPIVVFRDMKVDDMAQAENDIAGRFSIGFQ